MVPLPLCLLPLSLTVPDAGGADDGCDGFPRMFFPCLYCTDIKGLVRFEESNILRIKASYRVSQALECKSSWGWKLSECRTI